MIRKLDPIMRKEESCCKIIIFLTISPKIIIKIIKYAEN